MNSPFFIFFSRRLFYYFPFFFPNKWIRSNATGEATKIDDNVPIKIPINIVNENPRIDSPPNANKTMETINNVVAVITVRLNVPLMASLIVLSNGSLGCFFVNSRILSKITTVSFVLNPIIVNTAAIID